MSKKFLSPIKLAQGASVPSAGSAGELFYNTTDLKVYSHNGTAWVATGGGVTNSATAPTSPANGDAWFNTNEGRLFIYYADGTSNQWVEATPTPVSSENYQMPAGSIMAWGAATAPANWLLCNGAAVSRTTYASLFAAIGTQYGVGDGSTTFNLPDLRGRVVVGLDSSQSEFNFLGETGGAKTHTLTVSEMPSHNHGGVTSNAGTHTHGGVFDTFSNTGTGTSGINRDQKGTANQISASNGDHNHTISSQGGGGAHNNLQPYIVLNYIIKFSAGETPGDSQLATRVSAVEVANNATPLSPNYIINGALDYWQRGTSGTVAANGAAYVSADRFRVIAAGASAPTVTFARSTDVPSGIGAQYSGAFSWSAAASSGDLICAQYIENGKYLFAGKTVTVSFYAKATTAIGSILNFDQDYGNTSFNLTTSWARYSFTITLPSTFQSSRPSGTGPNDHVEVRFLRFTNSSISSNTIYFTGVQVEEGPNATPFRRSAPSLQAELAACHRYYYRVSAENTYGWFGTATGNGSNAWLPIQFPVQMRTTPSTIPEWSGNFSNLNFLLGGTPTSLVYAGDGMSARMATLTFGGSGFAAATLVRSNNNSNVYFGFSAEI